MSAIRTGALTMTAVPDNYASTTMSPVGIAFPAMRRFSVDEYHRMIENGILGENDRVELIDGWIVEMSPIGPPHATCVALLIAQLHDRLPADWILRVQSPITILSSEPEPDIVIARGSIRDFSLRHPTSVEIGIIIEAADASLHFDRQQKRKQYALANIAEYWIVNLVNRQLEVHRRPQNGDYTDVVALRSGEIANCVVPALAKVSVPVAEILP
jgi:Uma2 family endonuclease